MLLDARSPMVKRNQEAEHARLGCSCRHFAGVTADATWSKARHIPVRCWASLYIKEGTCRINRSFLPQSVPKSGLQILPAASPRGCFTGSKSSPNKWPEPSATLTPHHTITPQNQQHS